MSRAGFTVETRGQGAVILGGGEQLTKVLFEEFLLSGVQAISPKKISDVVALSNTHDLDYILVLGHSGDPDLLADLKSRIDGGESKLILLSHKDMRPNNFLGSKIFKHLIYSDYVGGGELVSPTLEGWLKHLSTSHDLKISGDGLSEISLLGTKDLAHLIVLSTLEPAGSGGEQIELGNSAPISLLTLAYLVRSNLDFKITLRFDEEVGDQSLDFDPATYADTLSRYNFHLSDEVEKEIGKYLRNYDFGEPKNEEPVLIEETKEVKNIVPIPVAVPKKLVEPVSPPLKKLTPLKVATPVFVPLSPKKPRLSLKSFKPRLPRPKTIVAKGFLIALALYSGTLAFTATIAGLTLKNISTTFSQGQLPNSSSLNNFSVMYLRANWIALTSIPGLSSKQSVQDISLLFDAYSQTIAVLETTKQLSSSTTDLIHYIFGSGNSDVASLVSLSRLQAEDLYQKLSLLDGSLPADPPSILADRYADNYRSVKEKLTSIKRSVITAKAVLSTTPDLIGLGGRRKYGVLFQNNMELRATGGFIGSFAILSFENGKLYDMPIFDVYDADGQLKGHVEPPAPIKNILGEANWYLRDSNFDPDFPTSARRAEWFIKKSLNQDLDGVIAVNVSTLVSLLEAAGPLDVPDYNETITAGNLYERAQFHAEVNFFPGSTQKKEFISTVADALFAKLPGLSGSDGLKLAEALSTSIEEKNTLISLATSGPDHVFQTLGWNGAISDFPCPSTASCHKDYAMVVDSNFGVNKANYFIKRNLEEIITFDKNLSPSHTLRVRYQNTSTSTAWPAGAYKNYQRVYLPVGSTITAIRVGDKTLSSNEYQISEEHGKLVVAYLVTVPISSNLTVEVDYTTSQLPQENELLYTWYWQKQPGTSKEDNLTVYLNYPLYLKPVVVSPTAEVAPQQLKFDFKNDTDHRVTVKFTK
ncbi:DUF4012 domain-containing protein [Candidatus Woesebacteria bacterium]|nr:DUF4012 domain-containing protein [Candidatus Woesebacteria bacterium]